MEPTTKTATGEHDGFPWKVIITKSPFNTYTATAEISCQMHNITVNFPRNEGKKGAAIVPSFDGKHLNENPFLYIVGFIEGFINGRNELVYKLIEGGEQTKNELKKLLSEGENMRPKTNATPEQTEQMKAETNRFIDTFSATGVSHLVKLSMGAEYNIYLDKIIKWKVRGRVPATLAHNLCLLEPVKNEGFTRESLRPDVKSWIQMDYPVEKTAS
tara:strand:+ start:75 stop:719 length:645 start_codon:yes stop_codon:yes gene_type:complete